MINTSLENGGSKQRVKLLASEFATRYSSKKEVYGFLSRDAKAYLSGYEGCSIYFLQALITGSKKCKYSAIVLKLILDVHCDKIRHIEVPYYEGLAVANIM